jgi:hypothetical protein
LPSAADRAVATCATCGAVAANSAISAIRAVAARAAIACMLDLLRAVSAGGASSPVSAVSASSAGLANISGIAGISGCSIATRVGGRRTSGEVAGVRICRTAAIGGGGQGGGGQGGGEERGEGERGEGGKRGPNMIFHGMVGRCLAFAGVEIFHGNKVKAGVRPVVGGVGFLENVFHVARNFVPAKSPRSRCWSGCTSDLCA